MLTKSLDYTAAKIWSCVPKPVRAGVLTALVCGFVTHIVAITGWLFNWDDSVKIGYGWIVTQGKWSSDFCYQFCGSYITAFGTLVAIVLIAVSVGFVIDALKIQSVVVGALMGRLWLPSLR